jgi:hypothetical protein
MLDRHAFRGERPAGPGHPSSFAGRATFDGVVACVPWPRDEVAARLMDGFELAPAVAPAQTHPLLVVFGEQRDPAVLRGGFALPLGRPYGELGVFVPYVRAAGGRRLCTYVSTMYSTYFPAVWEGNTRYFSKAVGNMSWRGPAFIATTEAGVPVLDALVAPAGDWRSATGADGDGVRAILDAVGLPMVGRPASGRLATSRFGWEFDAATVRPVALSMVLAGALLGVDMPREVAVGSAGALEVRGMTWRLGWPARFSGA